ncbi:class I SAM-dependent methyltransferase [Shinella pollutisoli]|uniref:Class I SAM-dependent methyltransferase n=1 Tax=Shinella pollutisoli TaxID=2250594 RepID=A0ABV7DAU4_9HYPH|nr:class I SAM-dependent methyltransferase [Shinella pollutisoli]
MLTLSSTMVDRIARRPGGLLGYLLYRFPVGHRAGFDLALTRLPPEAGDLVLEVGCGGGVFLRRLLGSGCRAIAVDHSPDMVANSGRLNAAALADGRLVLHQADAAALPVASATVDKAYCLNAFFFFPQPAESLKEMARALKPGGTLALVTAPPAFRRQIARISASMADNMRFDEPGTLAAWARDAALVPVETREVASAGYLFIARKEETA